VGLLRVTGRERGGATCALQYHNATNTAMVLASTTRFRVSASASSGYALGVGSSSPAWGVFQTCIPSMSPVSAVPFSGDRFPCAWHRAAG
jgi:hypothetical protein